MTCGRVEDVGFEPGAFIRPHGRDIVRKDFQRQFAAAQLSGLRFGPLQQRLGDALTAHIGMHDNIVNIEQRFGSEGGEARSFNCSAKLALA